MELLSLQQQWFGTTGVGDRGLDGGDAPPHLRRWKDMVLVRAGELARILIPFGTDTNPTSPFMFHRYLLRHEDNGMLGRFVIT